MKKRIWIPMLFLLILTVLTLPIPSGVSRDGNTREYTALTYKIVDWNKTIGSASYDKTRVYFLPHNFKTADQLWEVEKGRFLHSFIATVMELNDTSALVQPVPGSDMLRTCDSIRFSTTQLEDIGAVVGSVVQVSYTGEVMESYPAQIHAAQWQLSQDLRHMEYSGQWLDRNTSVKQQKSHPLLLLKITAIYNNCLFARTLEDSPYEIKVNYRYTADFCVGDEVTCTYANAYFDPQTQRLEVDASSVSLGMDFSFGMTCAKPVIYLYPQKQTEVSVKLTFNGDLTCTYPAHKDGWVVTADPDGTLTDAGGQTYNYLYWEGEFNVPFDLSKGFCIRGADTAAFLEKALAQLGLTRREANEFIVYWLPLMQSNPYNIISFQTVCYNQAAKLDISPAPDTLIRVFMAWQRSDTFLRLPAQELTAPPRSGFTVVEWGGSEIP